MSRFRPPNILWMLLIILGVAQGTRPAQAKSDKLVYEKMLPYKQKIVVLLRELEGTAKEQAQQKVRDDARRLWPGSITPMPDHFYRYLFRLSSASGKAEKELWQKLWVTYDDHPNFITFHDASYEALSATLVFTYKSSGVTCAEVIDPKARRSATNYQEPPVLLEDLNNAGVFIKAIVLGGSLAERDLTVSATNNIAEKYTFSWKEGRWGLSDLKPPPHPEHRGYTRGNIPFRAQRATGTRGIFSKALPTTGKSPPIAIEVPVPNTDKTPKIALFDKRIPANSPRYEGLSVRRNRISPAPVVTGVETALPLKSAHPVTTKVDEVIFKFAQWSDTQGWIIKTLWTHKIEMNPTFIPMEVYDAVYEAKDDVLVTIFRQNDVLRANIVRANEQGGRTSMEWPATELKPTEIDTKILTSAKIEGALADGSLRLLLSASDEVKGVAFAFQNGQWNQTSVK